MTSLSTAETSLSVRKLALSAPTLDEIAEAIGPGLQSTFAESSVHVAPCPDLRQPPFHLAGPGLCGNARIADVGGPFNIRPLPNLSAKYDLLTISELMEMPREGGLLIGAGAGPFHELGTNCELMPNLAYGSASGSLGQLRNCTRYAKVEEDGKVLCEEIGLSTGFGLMCNLLGCDGQPGPLLHIRAKGRKGQTNFTQSIQNTLEKFYGDRLVSLGGVFVISAGDAKLHVMPDFPGRPFDSDYTVENWLEFFDMKPPLVCLSVLHSGNDQGLDLRMEHTHCFAAEGEEASRRGGHYHYDLEETMQEVEYEGWFNVAETIYRIDSTRAVES
ncbi:hypothetical protein SCUP234_09849 [Seiridium cupressi]